MIRGVRQLGLFALSLLLLLPNGCQKEARGAFQAEAVTSGQSPIGLNDPVRIRFSRPLAADRLPRRAATVRDAEGHVVPIEIEREGRHLVILPKPSKGKALALWPRSSWLDVALPVPVAGPGFRSIDGRNLTAGFSARVHLLEGWSTRAGSLKLLSSVPRNAATGIRFAAENGELFQIGLAFDGPLDPTTASRAVTLIDTARGHVVEGATAFVNQSTNPHIVLVGPFNEGSLVFDANTTYEIRVSRHLRSLDGRRLAQEERRRFTTDDEKIRLLQINFDESADFCEADHSVRAFDPASGVLRASFRPGVVQSRSDGRTLAESMAAHVREWMGMDTNPNDVPHILSRAPSRTQILFAGAWLGASPRLIKSLSFLVRNPVETGTRAQGLQVTIGELNPELPDTPRGLSQDYDLNLIRGRAMHLPVDTDGYYDFRKHVREGERLDDGVGLVRLEFAEPYPYPGGHKNLVIDISNPAGILDWYVHAPSAHRGMIDILGFKNPQWGRVLLTGPANATHGFPAFHFLPSMVLEMLDQRPVTSRWHIVEDRREPRFLNPYVKSAPGCVQGRDFRIEYQAGQPRLDVAEKLVLRDGSPVIDPVGPFSPVPPRSGAKAVRLRITFDNRWHSPGENVPEIEYILMRYTGR